MAVNVYEGMFILDSNRYSRDAAGVSGQIPEMIQKLGGEILASRLWEERRLAYPINGHRKGTYWLTYFKLDSSELTDLTRQCQLSDSILRTLFLKVDPRIADALVSHALAGTIAAAARSRGGGRRHGRRRRDRRIRSTKSDPPLSARLADKKELTMASYNRVILVGNLTADPELRYIPSGTAVTEWVGRERPPQDRQRRMDRRDDVRRRHALGPHGRSRQRVPEQGLERADRRSAEARHLGKGRQEELQAPRRRRPHANARRSRRRRGRRRSRVAVAAAAEARPARPRSRDESEAGPPDDDIPF